MPWENKTNIPTLWIKTNTIFHAHLVTVKLSFKRAPKLFYGLNACILAKIKCKSYETHTVC